MKTIKDFEDLINKTDVREFKLMDGSSIMGEVVEEDDGGVLLAYTLQLDFDRGHVVMFPWFFSTNSNFTTLDWDRVIAYGSVDDNVKKSYLNHRMKERVIKEDPQSEFFFDLNPADNDNIH